MSRRLFCGWAQDSLGPDCISRPMLGKPPEGSVVTADSDVGAAPQRGQLFAVVEHPEAYRHVLCAGCSDVFVSDGDQVRDIVHGDKFGLFPEYVNGFFPECTFNRDRE